MDLRFTRAALEERYRTQASELVLLFAGVFQGGVISAAAFVLIEILQDPNDLAIRLVLWMHSIVLGFIAFFILCQRGLYQVFAGFEIVFMLPVLCLVEMALFAILSTTALGPETWKYWFFAATAVFANAGATNFLALRAMRPEHYDEETRPVYILQRAMIRRDLIENVLATVFTAALTAWIMLMPRGWRFATLFVGAHLVLTIVNGAANVMRDVKDGEKLRNAAEVIAGE